jgi:taurine dioxygenase
MEMVDLSPTIGVELRGLDLRAPLSDDDVAAIRDAFDRRHLVLVRDQPGLTRQQVADFVGIFGRLVFNSDGTPLITVVSNVSDDDITGDTQLLFHQDEVTLATDISEVPSAISMYAEDVDEAAVPTTFADAVRVYDELPGDLRESLADATAVHILDRDPNRDYAHRTYEWNLPENYDPTRYIRAEHPVFYPVSGDRKVVFVTEHQTSHIKGLSQEESEATLQRLYEILYSPEQLFTHHWRTGDLIVWNNQRLHHARPHRNEATRHMLRISIGGAGRSFYQDDPDGKVHIERQERSSMP